MLDVKKDKIKEIGSRVSGAKKGSNAKPHNTTRRAEEIQGVQDNKTPRVRVEEGCLQITTRSIFCEFFLNNEEIHGITYAGRKGSQGTYVYVHHMLMLNPY